MQTRKSSLKGRLLIIQDIASSGRGFLPVESQGEKVGIFEGKGTASFGGEKGEKGG